MEHDVARVLDGLRAGVGPRRGLASWAALLVAHLALLVAALCAAAAFPTMSGLLVAAGAFAFGSVQIGFLAHDFEHRQVAAPAWARDIVGVTVWNVLLGVSLAWWRDKHRRHHAHTHVHGEDPDLYAMFASDERDARALRGPRRWFVAAQAWLFWPVTAFARLYFQVLSLVAAARLRGGRRVWELAGLVLHHGLLAALTWSMLGSRALVFVLLAQMMCGLYMALAFSTNHLGMPLAETAGAGRAWQIAHTRNIGAGRVGTYLLGGLNLQIEHHLYPAMDRAALRVVAPRVQHACAAAGIPYHRTGLLPALLDVQRSLHRVAVAARAG